MIAKAVKIAFSVAILIVMAADHKQKAIMGSGVSWCEWNEFFGVLSEITAKIASSLMGDNVPSPHFGMLQKQFLLRRVFRAWDIEGYQKLCRLRTTNFSPSILKSKSEHLLFLWQADIHWQNCMHLLHKFICRMMRAPLWVLTGYA